jgi:hypothetical protein
MEEKRNRLFSFRQKRVGDFAMVQPDRSASVTSAALRTVGDETRDLRRRRRNVAQADRTWQAETYDYARKIGELGYLLNLQANTVALCDWPLRRWDEDAGDWVTNDPDEDGYDTDPVDVMDAFLGPQGGPEELYRRAALNLFTAGETHLLGTAQDSGNGILWEFLSVLELFPNAEGVLVRKRAGQTEQEVIPDDHYAARLWRSAASFSDLAESEVQRVLPICQEVVYLTQMVDATVKSRIPANMLFIPDELSFARPTGHEEDAESDPDADPLVDEIFTHMTTPVGDPTSAARLVPLVVRGKAEFGSAIQVIELSRPLDVNALELRQEALARLAQGLDTPPELMSGRAQLNHWTSAIIDQDFIVKHIIPVGRLIADFVTVAFLRPMLEAFMDMSAEEAAAWKLEFDPSPVIARADEAKSARDLAEILSDQAIAEANGFTKADMVGDDEKHQRRLWQLVMSNPTVFARLLPDIEGFESIDIDELLAAPGGGMMDQVPFDKEEELPEGRNRPAENEVPNADDLVDATSGQETPDQPEGLSLLVERLTTASDAAVKRALERAGSRVVAQAQGEQFATIRERISSARKDRVVSMLTPDELRRCNLSTDRLLAKAWDELAVNSRTWITSWLEDRGHDRYAADEIAALTTAVLCQALDEYTAANMIDGIPRHANGLLVPTGLVLQALESGLLSKA